MRQVKINDNVTKSITERYDSLITYAEAAFTKTGDKTHLEVIEKLKNSNAKIGLGFSEA